MLVKTYLDGPILLDSDTIQLFAEVFESGSSFIPCKNLVQGILAISWENLFLEIYRCMERLYSEPKVRAFRDDCQSDLSLHDLAALIETRLSWRPRENESLKLIIDYCDSETMRKACASLCPEAASETSDQSAVVAKQIYTLRNRIVPSRPVHEEIQKDDESWNAIVRSMLEITQQIYDKQGREFFEPVPS